MSERILLLEDIGKASAAAEELLSVRRAISAYDPRDCFATVEIRFGCGSGMTPASFDNDPEYVLRNLRAIESSYETTLYKLGVAYGPSAENPWERRRECCRRVKIEIQMAPAYAEYREAIRKDDQKFIAEFEAKTSLSSEDFHVFRDCVLHGA